jgi:hypothetical protein
VGDHVHDPPAVHLVQPEDHAQRVRRVRRPPSPSRNLFLYCGPGTLSIRGGRWMHSSRDFGGCIEKKTCHLTRYPCTVCYSYATKPSQDYLRVCTTSAGREVGRAARARAVISTTSVACSGGAAAAAWSACAQPGLLTQGVLTFSTTIQPPYR